MLQVAVSFFFGRSINHAISFKSSPFVKVIIISATSPVSAPFMKEATKDTICKISRLCLINILLVYCIMFLLTSFWTRREFSGKSKDKTFYQRLLINTF